MKIITPNEEFISSNFSKTTDIIKNTFEGPNIPLLKLIETLGERYAVSPASSKKDFHSAFPGGLCYHNLNVLTWIGKFAQLMAPGKYTKQSLVTVGILHDLGKVGNIEEEFYLPNKSDWHRERGMFFETNLKMQYMRIPHRSLFLAQQFNIPLTEEEYLAIMLHDGQYDEGNKNYSNKEPDLAIILHYADLWAARLEKQYKIVG